MTTGDDEPTVVLKRLRRPRLLRAVPAAPAVATLTALVLVAVLVWPGGRSSLPPPVRPEPAPVANQPAPAPRLTNPGISPLPQTPPRPRFTILVGDERTMLATPATTLLVFRYIDDPHVLVLSFPSLQAQGRMLNRLAAFVEKAGMPHDRVVSETELAAEMQRTNDTEASFYLGHDYRAADMTRFFAAAARDAIRLRPEEQVLHDLLDEQGLLLPGAVGALISIPPESPSELVDGSMRATILHHELSHGLYFTDTDYAAYSRVFWDTALTEKQRAGFRRFLASVDYDITIDDLMVNETQAYLVHTPDRRFFRPASAGLTDAESNTLRRQFVRDMPKSWLKDETVARLGGG